MQSTNIIRILPVLYALMFVCVHTHMCVGSVLS